MRRNPKISGTTHNVFGIQTGVAIAFFVRKQAKLGECAIHYTRREDDELAKEKLAYLRDATLESIWFEKIIPDAKANWLNQSDSNFVTVVTPCRPVRPSKPKLRMLSNRMFRFVLSGRQHESR